MTSKNNINQTNTQEIQQSSKEMQLRAFLKGLLASGVVTIANFSNVANAPEKVAEVNGGKNLYQKIIGNHLRTGKMTPGSEIGISIDKTLAQGSLGTMAYLQFSVPSFRTKLSMAYIDHNTLQNGIDNSDDKHYNETVPDKSFIPFSKVSNSICSQENVEQFVHADWTLGGDDSQIPALGGAGGLDLAVKNGGGLSYMTYPNVMRINLNGNIANGNSVKEIILEVIKLISSNGNGGWVVEYGGSGLASLSVLERQAIANMGAETGLTISIFPSDQVTRSYLKALGREYQWVELAADANATYDKIVNINVAALEQCGKPSCIGQSKKGPGRPRKMLDQVMIDSCAS
jgi:aconitate hydratase